MKNAIFLVLIALSLQGIAQVKSGVYQSSETIYLWYNQEGVVTHEEVVSEGTYFQVEQNGIRIFYEMPDYGVFYPWMYSRKDGDVNFYTIYEEDACKINVEDEYIIIFYDFNHDSGFYDRATEFNNVVFKQKKPDIWEGK
tara:strand:- start:359 stop:778 length:420 start_codon:yes stop_codon:yes gene_type:complete